MPTKITKFLTVSLLTLSIVSSATLASAWTAPTVVPPGANVDEPINRGPVAQSKGGGFGALWGIFTDLLVTGSIQGINATTGAISTLALNLDGGNVGIGTPTPGDKLDVAGNLRVLTGSNPIRFTAGWSGFPDAFTNQAEISNDTGGYKTLMIVGNKSNDLSTRRVSVWDRLDVNGTLNVTGDITSGGIDTDHKVCLKNGTNCPAADLTNLTIASIKGTDQMIENALGAYQHIGGWGVGRTDATAVLVNTAYMADNATNLNGGTVSATTGTFSGLLAANGGINVDGQTVVDDGAGWHRTYGNTGWYNGTYCGGWYMTDSSWIRSYCTRNVYIDALLRADGGVQVDGYQVIDSDAGWHRTYGNTGWYNGTYGGGWYMIDDAWIRGYNNKSLWMGAGLVGGDGGLTIGYGGVSSPDKGAIIAGNVGIGTTDPGTYKLNVAGDTNISGAITGTSATLDTLTLDGHGVTIAAVNAGEDTYGSWYLDSGDSEYDDGCDGNSYAPYACAATSDKYQCADHTGWNNYEYYNRSVTCVVQYDIVITP